MASRTTRLRTLWIVAVAVLAAGGLAAWWFGGSPDQGADPADPRQVALGAALYGEHCASCHGADLEGQPNWRQRLPSGLLPAPPHDESGHTWHHPDRQLFDITKHGSAALAGPDYRTTMIGFGDRLSDAEIWAVLAYIKSRWPEPIRRRQAQISGNPAQ